MRLLIVGGFASIAFPLLVLAQAEPATEPADSTAGSPGDLPRIDVLADQRLQEMSDFLEKQKHFRFNVEIVYDAVEPDGQKVQLGRRSRVEIRRPDRLYAESQGDRGWDQTSVYDGRHFLLYDKSKNLYSRTETPPTLDEFFEFLFDEHGASPPLVDFLVKDVHAALSAKADSGALLGEAFVAEKECDHLVFSSELLDWQVWIDRGDAPWPRKFVITYKDVDVRPQFMAVFRDWSTDVPSDPQRFLTSPPGGAAEIPLRAVVESAAADSEDAAGADGADAGPTGEGE